MSREDEYRAKCRRVKEYYGARADAYARLGKARSADEARRWRDDELAELDRQYREGEEMEGLRRALG